MRRLVDKCKNSAMINALLLNFWHKSELFVKFKTAVILNNVIGRHKRRIIYLGGSTSIIPPYFLVCFTFT